MFLTPHLATTSFQQDNQRKCPTPHIKDNLEEVIEIHQEEIPQNRIICSPPYSWVLPHFPRVPTIIIVGQVTFNAQRYNFIGSPDNTIDLLSSKCKFI